MSLIDWRSRAATLSSDLASASGADAQYATGLLAELNAVGARYDGSYSTAIDAARSADEAAYEAAITTWQLAAEQVHAQADRVARYCELQQAAAQAGSPSRYSFGDVVLSSDVPFALGLDGATEPTMATAGLALTAGGALALTLVARDVGAVGNLTHVAITNGSTAATFNLAVSRGANYIESHADMRPGAALPASRLIASWSWSAPALRPDNVSTTLAGGAGGVHKAIGARLTNASAFDVVTPGLAALVQAQFAALDGALAGAPTLAYSRPYDAVSGIVSALVALVAQADAFHQYIASRPA